MRPPRRMEAMHLIRWLLHGIEARARIEDVLSHPFTVSFRSASIATTTTTETIGRLSSLERMTSIACARATD